MKIGRLIISNKKRNDSKILVYDILNKKIYCVNEKFVADIKNEKKIKQLETLFDKTSKEITKSEKKIQYDDKVLNLVRILVTNNCNLKCRYCYAFNGSYGHEIKNMSLETANEVCEYLIMNYKFIKEINFFGGEPMLNIKVIDFICNKLTSYYNNSDIKKPVFSIVTNGTIISDQILEVVKKYNINVIVSLDYANKEINDKNRIYFDNRGTFDTINKNIKEIIKTSSIFALESTYNEEHIKRNISYIDIMKKNFSEYGVKLNIISPVSNKIFHYSNKKLISENSFGSQLKFFIEKGICNQEILSFLKSIYSHSYSYHYCDALVGQIAISPIGDIYPCQMFIATNMNPSLKKFCVGNVKEKKLSRRLHVAKWFNEYNTKNLKKCNNCKIKSNCGECAFYNFIENHFERKCENKEKNFYKEINNLLDIVSKDGNEIKLKRSLHALFEKGNLFLQDKII